MTDVVTRLIVRADGSLAVLDQFGKKMSDAGQAADMATGGLARFEAAQKRMQAAQQAGLAITTENIARRTKEQRVFEQAASSIDKNYAMRIRLEREAERSAVAMSNAVAAGYLRQEQALEILMQQERQHAAMLSGGARGAVGGGSFSTANIAAQFQDIGVTAAMGMNSLQIALQQGTQLASVMGSMEKPLQGIASGLLSVISPLSLITIGFVALVAAGLQFVDWGSVAQATLNFLADGLEVIAPYAAAAAVGLALLYSPAILAGIGTAVGALGTMATAIWGVATAIYATVGLPAVLIAGLIAMATAAVIWRDDLAKMLGVDIVGAAQDGINYIIGAFVGGFQGVQLLWATLPAVLGDITIQAAQAVLDGVTRMLNESRTQVLGFLSWVSTLPLPGVNSLASVGAGALVGAGELTSPQIRNDYEGTAAAVASYSADTMSSALATNYLGDAVSFMQGAASGAADALRGLADSIGVDEKASKAAAKEAERQAEAYRDLTRDALQFIEEQHLEAQALGMTQEAANRLRYEQEMLNKAANDNIKLSTEQRAELSGLAAGMAAAEESTRRLTEIYDFGKEVFSGFFSDMKSGLQEGQSFWEALGNAGANALDKIADRALGMAADGIFDMIFGSIMGGITGGLGAGGPGFLGGGASSWGPSFDGGGDTGYGSRTGGVDGRGGFRAILHPNETVIDHTRPRPANQNQSNDNGGSVHVTIERIEANSYEGGVAAANGFQAGMRQWRDSGEGARFVRAVVNNPHRANPR